MTGEGKEKDRTDEAKEVGRQLGATCTTTFNAHVPSSETGRRPKAAEVLALGDREGTGRTDDR